MSIRIIDGPDAGRVFEGSCFRILTPAGTYEVEPRPDGDVAHMDAETRADWEERGLDASEDWRWYRRVVCSE